LTGIEPEP